MSTLAYTVIAETDSEDSIRAYADWLIGGHIAEVVRAGALSGMVVRHDREPGKPFRAEVRYTFGSREAFRAYEAGPAAGLRAEGLALFGPESAHPIRFTRTLGEIVANIP